MGLYSWFQRQPQQVEDLQSDVASYTMEEVGCHNTRNDIWMVIHGKVYDVTGFLCKHPGGIEVLLDCAGVDATAYFDDVGHSEDSKLMLTPLYKGEIIGNKVLNEKHSSVGTKGYRWFPFMLDFRDYADSFNFVDSLQKHELVKRKRQRPLYVYKNKGYIILAIVAVLSALGFFHLQQRKWH